MNKGLSLWLGWLRFSVAAFGRHTFWVLFRGGLLVGAYQGYALLFPHIQKYVEVHTYLVVAEFQSWALQYFARPECIIS